MSRLDDRIDPESLGPLQALRAAVPGGFGAIGDIVERRAVSEALFRASRVGLEPNPRVSVVDRNVPGPPGAPDITLRVYRPLGIDGELPVVYLIHGGGMVAGTLDGSDDTACLLAERVGALVVSVDYRLAPEHPYPAGLHDCVAGLSWVSANSAGLGADPDRLAMVGFSAGGGLALGVALLARDHGGTRIAFLLPAYPMVDDTNTTASSHEITDVGIWDRATNAQAWSWYLGGAEADGLAAPARAEDLAGLPPTFIDVGGVDLFRDEDIVLAARLARAGVPTELHVHPHAYHASELFAPDADLSHHIWDLRVRALRRALGD